MDEIRQDLRYAVRTFRRSPGFTAVILFTLAFGIGGNTAIFGLMDQLLFRPLPVPHPEQLVVIDAPGPYSGHSQSSSTVTPISHPMYTGLRDGNTVFSGLFVRMPVNLHVTVGQQTSEAAGQLVSGTFFPTLGLPPALGRLLTPQDDGEPGANPVVVVSHGFWSNRLGRDPQAVGRTLQVNGHAMTVVGVAPEGFHGVEVGQSDEVYVPLSMYAQAVPTWGKSPLGDWRRRWLVTMARLKDGVTAEQAASQVNVLYARLLQDDLAHFTSTTSARHREEFARKKLELLPGARGTSDLRAQSKMPLLVLMGMVGLVLLIACANVANLLLARASSRRREVALRLALGAERGRLVRQFLAESLLLSLAGGLLGLVLSVWAAQALVAALPDENARATLVTTPDLRVVLFALGLSVATSIVFGLVPALQGTGLAVASSLKEEAGAVVGGSRPFRFRKGLVVAQVALSLLLLIGAGLFTRSLANLRALDPGFRPESLLTFTIQPSLSGYAVPQRYALFQSLQEELSAEPGARSVSMAWVPLMANSDSSSTVVVEGYAAKEDEDMNPGFNGVGPGFFDTLGIRLVAGREFTTADALGTPKVAVVNETFARYFFPGQDPIGRRFGRKRDNAIDTTIVGVVRDGKSSSLREEPQRFVYYPYAQQENVGTLTYYVRTNVDPEALAVRVREVARKLAPSVPVTNLKTMRAQIGESLFVDRLVASLSAAFGLLATLLAAVGLYGVMSYAVSLRSREIGVRMALGAPRATVLRMILGEVAVLTTLGVAIGLPGGYGLGRLVEAQLFGLTARDPLTFAVATAALLTASFLAGWLPARRATRIDPMLALRA